MRRSWLLAAAAATACSSAPAKQAADASAPPPPGLYAVLKTDRGEIDIRLFRDDAPKTVEAFSARVKSGAWAGSEFARAVPGFIVQAAGPSGGPPLPLEVPAGRGFEKAGRVAAPAAVGGASSDQFFVTLVAAPWLDGKNTVFGEVTAGLELLSAAANELRTERGEDGRFVDRPLKPVVVESARLEERK